MTQRDRWAKRPVVLRYFDYRDALREATTGFTEPTELRLVFYIPMPKSWPQKKQLLKSGEPHDAKPDIDNLVKGVMDALYTDDKIVYAITAEKYWSNSGSVVIY